MQSRFSRLNRRLGVVDKLPSGVPAGVPIGYADSAESSGCNDCRLRSTWAAESKEQAKDYRFLIFLDGETTSLDGRYQLIDFEPEATTFFSKGFQANLVASPAEKQRHVPRSRPKLAKPALKNAAALLRTDS